MCQVLWELALCMTAAENTLLVLESLTSGRGDTCDMLVYFKTEI